MRVHLVNPSHVSFGVAVITPRWLYVLAAATPKTWGDPLIVDETLESIDMATIQVGDVVGIGLHTGNACATVGKRLVLAVFGWFWRHPRDAFSQEAHTGRPRSGSRRW
jgi:hypothetical protein